MRLLLVEDNSRLGKLTCGALKAAGFAADLFSNAEEAEAAMAVVAYDVIVLDLGLPDRDGASLLEPARRHAPSAPILILTARDDSSSVIDLLNRGADDYLCKPFVMDVLIARVRALLRRPGTMRTSVLSERNVELDPAQYRVRVGGHDLDISRRELSALELLMRRSSRVISRADFEESMYGFGEEVSSNAVEVLIHRLRRKLEGAGAEIEIHNLRGLGYMLAEKRP
ncbi:MULTISPECIES: response regulator [Rhizobium]|uniref:Response regulator transcription factor n=2 Tax=Rhizobium TaxID=379 RepID=A0AAF1KFN2_9HYPH|nr:MULTISPECIES: response regulator transcription factor [Rhizobium]MBO9100537.1 response regulator transcription factor [Rhizobium sp. L58/93]MBO9136101.1 response regulator transcription factor [Rhizobium sp. B209b/85]MBO9171412.1 response regulator transcription factor [Rhizobium sp. L245/93]MBO9187279.1 response regulator transcription factor [Rhizobium sp. E27B/91]MBZ5759421.1 response regulator transcription factor [Rhizobium sp. VS19-DR96]